MSDHDHVKQKLFAIVTTCPCGGHSSVRCPASSILMT